MTVLNCSDYPNFRVGQPEQTRDTAHFHVIGNGGDIFCVSNAHCVERYFEGLTAIFRHIPIICYLNARVGQNQRVKTLQKHT
jgi:hypothetical protein